MNGSATVEVAQSPFTTFLDAYRQKLRELFTSRADFNEISRTRGLPPYMLREIVACKPLSTVIPVRFGGRGEHIHEFLSMLAVSSYESLALSLMMGINGGLFLQPVSKYGHPDVHEPIFRRFLDQGHMGGLMITEPDFGSDALSMQTNYTEEGDRYHLRGLKHWAGLTGWADFWLVTGRRRDADGQLARDIDFFIVDVTRPEQRIEVEEVFHNLGLYMLPYGRNRIDVLLPKNQRLQPESTGVKMMLDTLYRSRMQFPGMAMGFLQRMLDEGIAHCKTRHVGGQSLFGYDQVQERLARLQAAYTTCSAMCTWSSENAGVHNNLWKSIVPANSIKAVITDLMQDSAQSLLQLTGAKGYRIDHVAGRSLVDSRPFQIFEGSNDILYQQISEGVLKSMRKLRESNLYRYLSEYDLTARASDYFKHLLDFQVDLQLPQRKLIDLGKMLGRIVSMEMTIELGTRGFRNDLVTNAVEVLRDEVTSILSHFRSPRLSEVVDDYLPGSGWLSCVRAEGEN